MKFYLLPVIALILGGVWIVYPRREISSIEDASTLLQKDIVAARPANLDTAPPLPKPKVVTPAAKTRQQLDWVKIANQLAQMRKNRGAEDLRTITHLDHRAESMGKEELAAALDEIGALDLPAGVRAELEEKLIREQLEGALISALFGSDPEAVPRRLDPLPEEQRGMVLANFMCGQLGSENQVAFAKIVRKHLPEKIQAATLSVQARALMDDGSYTNVDDFLDRIAATAAERIACVERVVGSTFLAMVNQKKVTRADFAPLREWATSHAPDLVDSITGKTLALLQQIPDKACLAAASDLVVPYHETSDNDDILTSFLGNLPIRANNEQARLIAAKIDDPKRREEILKQL